MLSAAILAGGSSSRMGANKALLSFRGQPMICAVLGAAHPIASEIFVVADHPGPYRALGMRVIPDIHPGRGPMGGLHAALTAAAGDEVLLLSCDIPLVSTELLRYLAASPATSLARVPATDARVHPLCAIYDRRCLPVVDRLIAGNHLAMTGLLDAVGAQRVAISPDLPFYRPNLLANINDPAALQAEESGG